MLYTWIMGWISGLEDHESVYRRMMWQHRRRCFLHALLHTPLALLPDYFLLDDGTLQSALLHLVIAIMYPKADMRLRGGTHLVPAGLTIRSASAVRGGTIRSASAVRVDRIQTCGFMSAARSCLRWAAARWARV